jgi:hypothetical protein
MNPTLKNGKTDSEKETYPKIIELLGNTTKTSTESSNTKSEPSSSSNTCKAKVKAGVQTRQLICLPHPEALSI